jgi:uncharacterized protein YqeY
MNPEYAKRITEKINEKPEKANFLIIYETKKKNNTVYFYRVLKGLNSNKIAKGVVEVSDKDTAWVLADYIRKRREKVKVFFAFPIENIDDLEKL